MGLLGDCLAKVRSYILRLNFFSDEPLVIHLNVEDLLFYLKAKIVDSGKFCSDFRLFYKEKELEVENHLPLNQIFDVENSIEVYILTPDAATLRVVNLKANCKLLVGKGANMNILAMKPEDIKDDVVLAQVNFIVSFTFF